MTTRGSCFLPLGLVIGLALDWVVMIEACRQQAGTRSRSRNGGVLQKGCGMCCDRRAAPFRCRRRRRRLPFAFHRTVFRRVDRGRFGGGHRPATPGDSGMWSTQRRHARKTVEDSKELRQWTLQRAHGGTQRPQQPMVAGARFRFRRSRPACARTAPSLRSHRTPPHGLCCCAVALRTTVHPTRVSLASFPPPFSVEFV